MTYETYENLSLANDRRKRAAAYTGNWKEVARCCEEAIRLDAEFARSISPEPAGHPDNPLLASKPDESACSKEFLRMYGERPEAARQPGAEASCGNCKHLRPDYSHPLTDGKSILEQRGWICACPELGCFSGWSTESLCECHEPLFLPLPTKS
jgi:hypothetical protein